MVTMAFTAATYNVLATAYLGKGDYSGVARELLDPARRVPALVRHVAALDADLLCLQEVEDEVFAALRAGLEECGYAGRYEPKGRAKPDGCATFYRTTAFVLRAERRLEYRDDEKGPGKHSGFVALLLALEHEGRLLGVANTHLRWDRPGTPRRSQIGRRQAVELLDERARFTPSCDGWLLCGDLNCRPDGAVVTTLRQAGLEYAHAGRARVCSAVINGRATLIDYLFHSPELAARPIDPGEPEGVLPAPGQPSDHLALLAEFGWAGPREQPG
jgi:mRNA deadenylase 3'-5' endonuclease subunit Ccr4